MKKKISLNWCLKFYGCTKFKEFTLLSKRSLIKNINAVRIVEYCPVCLSSEKRLSSLIDLINRINNEITSKISLHYELPPLFADDLDGFVENLNFLIDKTKQEHIPLSIVANDYGILQICSGKGTPIILGRAFSKSHLRLPASQRFPPGRWLTLDAITLYLPKGPPTLPYSNKYSVKYLKLKGVIGADIDGESYLVKESIAEIEEQLSCYIHVDDIFMASGRNCFFSDIYGECKPNKCFDPSFYFRYQKNINRNYSMSYYSTPLFFRGKNVYRHSKLDPEQLANACSADTIFLSSSYY